MVFLLTFQTSKFNTKNQQWMLENKSMNLGYDNIIRFAIIVRFLYHYIVFLCLMSLSKFWLGIFFILPTINNCFNENTSIKLDIYSKKIMLKTHNNLRKVEWHFSKFSLSTTVDI